MIKTNYEIQNKHHKTIALLADIHFSKHYPNKILNNIIDNLKENNPDFICIPGDIIDDAKVIDNKDLSNKLKDWLQEVASIAPLIISYGNHDEVYIKCEKEKYVDTTKFFDQLNQINNVYFLNNQNIIFGNINFVGFHPNKKYFIKKEKYDLTADLKNIEEKIIEEKYNILLCHSPSHIFEYNLPVNLILSGHMHDGLIFPFLKNIRGNFGFVGPHHTFFPKNSRGMIQNERTKMIITGGIRKISNCAFIILKPLNLIYPPEITYIKI